MSKDFNLSVHLSPETKKHLNRAARRIDVPRDVIVAVAVEHLLHDLGFDGFGKAGGALQEVTPSDRE